MEFELFEIDINRAASLEEEGAQVTTSRLSLHGHTLECLSSCVSTFGLR
jgi:hypothetical protein